jgi:ABC-type iron transport system FetAB ATPase subunit
LLKCIAQLAVYQAGAVTLRGEKPEQVAGGIPAFRTKVLYLPQRPSLLPGSPTSFLETVKTFRSRSSASSSPASSSSWLPGFLQRKQAVALPEDGNDETDVLDPYELASEWDVPRMLWERNWGDLSGGEGQRIALATAFARGSGFGNGAEVILLDGAFKQRPIVLCSCEDPQLTLAACPSEPTSALDPETTSKVEATLLSFLPRSEHNPAGSEGRSRAGKGGPKAYLLITHSDEQAERLAGKGARVVDLSEGVRTPSEREPRD